MLSHSFLAEPAGDACSWLAEVPVYPPAGRGRPWEKPSGACSQGCNYTDTQISSASGEVVAHNPQKQQRVAASGLLQFCKIRRLPVPVPFLNLLSNSKTELCRHNC